MEWILTREMVIGLAILGAVPSTIAPFLQSKLGAQRARQFNLAGYGLMGASILLFIIIGFRS